LHLVNTLAVQITRRHNIAGIGDGPQFDAIIYAYVIIIFNVSLGLTHL
jgi:hypothetical protein